MVVLEKSYLVGQVIEVNYTTSRAILISDLNSNIPVIVEPGSYQSILGGTGKDYGKIKYLKDEIECLAACNGGPMMQINHKNYENISIEQVDKIIENLK